MDILIYGLALIGWLGLGFLLGYNVRGRHNTHEATTRAISPSVPQNTAIARRAARIAAQQGMSEQIQVISPRKKAASKILFDE